jgi:hypothetical protein
LYVVPTVPSARLVVVMESVGTDATTMVTLNACVALALPLVTCAVKPLVATVEGVPLSTPPLDNVSPAGVDPLTTLHV